MPKATCLIQGASRGIGLEFVRNLLKRDQPTHVIATCQQMMSKDNRLFDLQQECHSDSKHRLDIIQLDVRHSDDMDKFTKSVEDCLNSLKHERGLDLLINCAHILHPSNRVETNLDEVLGIDLNDVYQVNVVGPLLVTKMLMNVLKRGRNSFGKSSAALVVNISAQLASISNNKVGGWYAYRLSKCALNMATKNLAIEFGGTNNVDDRNHEQHRPLLFVSMHPGIVNSDMIHAYKKLMPDAQFQTKEEVVKKMLKTIDNLTLEYNGKFIDYNGKEEPY